MLCIHSIYLNYFFLKSMVSLSRSLVPTHSHHPLWEQINILRATREDWEKLENKTSQVLVRVQWTHTTHKTRHFHEEKKIIGNFLTNTCEFCVNTRESEESKPTILSPNPYCNHFLVPFVDFHWTESVEVHSSKREYRFLKKGRH